MNDLYINGSLGFIRSFDFFILMIIVLLCFTVAFYCLNKVISATGKSEKKTK